MWFPSHKKKTPICSILILKQICRQQLNHFKRWKYNNQLLLWRKKQNNNTLLILEAVIFSHPHTQNGQFFAWFDENREFWRQRRLFRFKTDIVCCTKPRSQQHLNSCFIPSTPTLFDIDTTTESNTTNPTDIIATNGNVSNNPIYDTITNKEVLSKWMRARERERYRQKENLRRKSSFIMYWYNRENGIRSLCCNTFHILAYNK